MMLKFTKPKKKIVYSIGGKGGGGKTTAIVSVVDFFLNEKVPVLLVDADIENKKRGSLSYFFKDTPKVYIRTPRGLDDFVDRLLGEERLADPDVRERAARALGGVDRGVLQVGQRRWSGGSGAATTTATAGGQGCDRNPREQGS